MKLFLWTNKLLFLITILFASLCVIMNFTIIIIIIIIIIIFIEGAQLAKVVFSGALIH